MTTLPLSELRFGHEHPGLSLNSRATDRDAGLESLAASILAKDGIIEPLVVVERSGVYYVVDGNRRLAAMRKLAADGLWASAHERVPVVERDEDDALAIETSLIANLEREPLHPVDAYEAFALLEAQGATATDIAARFGLTTRQVGQRLALGRLAPEVREAWRGGAIGAEVAQAFTVVADPAIQAKVLADMKARGQLYPHSIKSELGAHGSAADLKFIGEEAYQAAGGRMVADLFSDHRYVLDGAVLTLLVREKLQAVCDALTAEGWKWAMIDDDAPDGIYSWVRIDPEPIYTDEQAAQMADLDSRQESGDLDRYEARFQRNQIAEAAKAVSFTAEQKARSGVILVVNYAGEITFKRGLVMPADEAAGDREVAAAPTADDEPDGGAGAEPKAVVDRLRETLTVAWATVVKDYHGMALELFLATWLAGPGSGSPVTFKAKGAKIIENLGEWIQDDGQRPTFAEALAAVQALNHADRSRTFSMIIARSLDMTSLGRDQWNGSGVTDEGVAAVAANYTGVGGLDALRREFDAEAYFGGAKKGHAMVAIEECMGPEVAKQWAGRKKTDVAKFAQEIAAQKGWLPPSLRVPGYSVGPTPLADRAAAAVGNVKAKRARRAAAASAAAL